MKMIKLREERKEYYLKNEGTNCPFCGSDNLEGQNVDINDGIILQYIICKNCDNTWTDIYKLCNITTE